MFGRNDGENDRVGQYSHDLFRDQTTTIRPTSLRPTMS